uniref:Small heat shock protein n=1 Tax=Belgica antarctica TaxID=315563 RepID=Q1KS37_9DIPT|nr:small heat shock protein [Belgica antarctica]
MRCGPENRCRRGPMMSGCQIPKGKRCGKGCPRGNCAATPLSDDYEVSFDVKSSKPEEIEVKVKDRTIHVEAKHEEREDELGFVSRQFARRFVLPQEFDPETISTFLNAEGKMTIKAAKPKPPVDETKERVIPIQRLAADAAPSTPPSEPEWEKVEDGEKAKKVDKPTEE